MIGAIDHLAGFALSLQTLPVGYLTTQIHEVMLHMSVNILVLSALTIKKNKNPEGFLPFLRCNGSRLKPTCGE